MLSKYFDMLNDWFYCIKLIKRITLNFLSNFYSINYVENIPYELKQFYNDFVFWYNDFSSIYKIINVLFILMPQYLLNVVIDFNKNMNLFNISEFNFNNLNIDYFNYIFNNDLGKIFHMNSFYTYIESISNLNNNLTFIFSINGILEIFFIFGFCLALWGLIYYKQNLLIIYVLLELIIICLVMLFICTGLEKQNISILVSSLYFLTIAGAEASIGLSILVLCYRITGTISLYKIYQMKL